MVSSWLYSLLKFRLGHLTEKSIKTGHHCALNAFVVELPVAFCHLLSAAPNFISGRIPGQRRCRGDDAVEGKIPGSRRVVVATMLWRVKFPSSVVLSWRLCCGGKN